jgi:hypothetical protein
VKVLAEWRKGEEVYPAIIENSFGKGKAFLLTSTYMLHPANDGGVSSIEQIEKFYEKALKALPGQTDSDIALSPWPYGHSSAACITFNSSDDPAKYRMILEFIKNEDLSAAFVIDSAVSSESIELLNDSDRN